MAEQSRVGPRPESDAFRDSSRSSAEDNVNYAHCDDLTQKQAWCLYLSHFLSMWNSRMYEWAVILFIQVAFPGNLLASSINGIAETICVLLFSSALGRWVDQAPSRLHTLILTINANKFMVLASCLIWFLILSSESAPYKRFLFALVLVLGMVEKLSRMTNILSMERDWIPTLANPPVKGRSWTPYGLTHLNTTIRRIDMLCKIGGPLAIATFISSVSTHKVATIVVAVVSTVSWGVECWAVTNVSRQNRRLQTPKTKENDGLEMDVLNTEAKWNDYSVGSAKDRSLSSIVAGVIAYVEASLHSHMVGLRYFFSSTVCIPSICVALLHASVLSYSGTFTNYLLNAGFTLGVVTVAKAIGSVFEIASTVVFPHAVARLSSTKANQLDSYDMREPSQTEVRESLLEDGDDSESGNIDQEDAQKQTSHFEEGIVRVGLWGICGLAFCLIPVMYSLFRLDATLPPPSNKSDSPPPLSPLSAYTLTTLTLLFFLSVSFLGRWTYDLSAMQLTQVLIPATHRSSFGGTEMAIVSVFSLGHWVAAAIWNQQGDFKWLALGSFVAVGVAAGGYWMWCRWWEAREGKRRGEAREGGAGRDEGVWVGDRDM